MAKTRARPAPSRNSCLMARRLVERGVRFVQVYHRGWDVHGNLPEVLPSQCKDIDQGCWALVQDLKQRGMLDDTLVIWGGEFGRTIYSQGQAHADRLRPRPPSALLLALDGRRRHERRRGPRRDRRLFSYNIIKDPVHVRDLQATCCTSSASTTTRFTYQVPGSRSETHRRRKGERDQGDCLTRRYGSRQKISG